jgi:hypothetical protein
VSAAREALKLLIADLRRILFSLPPEHGRLALRRILLFEMMQPAEVTMKKVLLLRTDSGEHVVCDEYYPADYGRVHVLGEGRYGQFNRDDMSLEYAKVALTIEEIVYEGDDWPVSMLGREIILAHFGLSS